METGEVHTANFPEDYESDSECSWLITVSQGSSVGLQFQSFKVHISELPNFSIKK